MTAYRLLITPEDDVAQCQGQAVIRVETAPVPRITDITVITFAADGRSAATLPAIDLEGVIDALTAGTRPPVTEAAPVRRPTGRKTDRPYRQMPDRAELSAVFHEVGTVTGVAAHYGVPRYTAQGWISRLRNSAEQ